MVSLNKENYMRALYILDEEGNALTVTNVSKYLHISKPSVSEMMKNLDDMKWIVYNKYSKIFFTRKGKLIARKLTVKHRLIEIFLKDTLKVNIKEVHAEADKLEHAVSDRVLIKLKKFLGNPIKDPHGKVIPDGK